MERKIFNNSNRKSDTLFLTKQQIRAMFSTCCPQILLNNLSPTETPQSLGIYKYTLLPYNEFHKSSNSTVLCRNNDYTYETHKITSLHDKTIQTFNTMKILQQSLQSRNQNTTSRRKRGLLDAFVDAGQRLNATLKNLPDFPCSRSRQ